MKKLYKDGKECMADDDQLKAMIKNGWKTEASMRSAPEAPKPAKVEPEPVPEEVVEEPAEEETDAEEETEDEETPVKAPRKIPRRKSAKSKE